MASGILMCAGLLLSQLVLTFYSVHIAAKERRVRTAVGVDLVGAFAIVLAFSEANWIFRVEQMFRSERPHRAKQSPEQSNGYPEHNMLTAGKHGYVRGQSVGPWP